MKLSALMREEPWQTYRPRGSRAATGHILLAVANAAVLVVLVLLLRGWLPGRPLTTHASRN